MSTQRVISPSRETLRSGRPPLEAGEELVLDFFDDLLNPAWEIYVQPFLNGLRPDFVLLNPAVGVGVFEIKDWNLEVLRYQPAEALGQIQASDPKTGKTHLVRSPFQQVTHYESELRRIYCPRLGEAANIPVLTAGVIFTHAPTQALRTLFKPELEKIGEKGRRYRPVSGEDDLRSKNMAAVFPESRRPDSALMNEDLADDLRRWLVEPRHANEQSKRPTLDSRQRQFASSRTESGFRRIRGAAGSGKTVVVAARAAALASEGKSVLVTYFNLTLGNYLRDMFVRFGQPRNGENVVWLNFHEWCRRTIRETGHAQTEGGAIDLDAYLDFELPDRVLTALKEGPFSDRVGKYDAILVDEGQDFLPGWWAALRAVLKPGGEMILVADRAQDIYERNRSWTEQAMEGAGFSGPWSELDTSYRMPEQLRSHVKDFANEFGLDRTTQSESSLSQTQFDFCDLRWRQVERTQLATELFDEYHQLNRADSEFSMSDVNFIVDSKDVGRRLVGLLEEKGVHPRHTLDTDEKKERAAKLCFYKGSGQVGVTTIHSFKGWEAPILIVGISKGDPELVYTALSRLKGSEVGSHLHVVCGDQRFSDYGETWSREDKHNSATQP